MSAHTSPHSHHTRPSSGKSSLSVQRRKELISTTQPGTVIAILSQVTVTAMVALRVRLAGPSGAASVFLFYSGGGARGQWITGSGPPPAERRNAAARSPFAVGVRACRPWRAYP